MRKRQLKLAIQKYKQANQEWKKVKHDFYKDHWYRAAGKLHETYFEVQLRLYQIRKGI